MSVAIQGASGHLGRATIDELKVRLLKDKIIAVSRTPEKITDVASRLGDYDRPDTLVAAYKGVHTLFLIPSNSLGPGVRVMQIINAVDAALKAGVEHIVYASVAGAKNVSEPNIFATYFRAEQHLQRHVKKWTIIRMNYYSESFVEEVQMSLGQGALAGFGDSFVGFVSRKDVAAAAAGVLSNSAPHDGAIYTATGPERISGPQRAQLASVAVGKQLHYVPLTEDALRAGLADSPLPPLVQALIIDMKIAFSRGQFDIVTGDVQNLSGRAPTSLQQVLSDSFKQK